MAVSPPVVVIPTTYEFTQKQNALVRALATRMRLVGAGLLAVAVMLLAVAVFGRVDVPSLLTVLGVVLGCIGFWSIRAAVEMRAIVRTRGADIPHLIRALGELRKLYDVQLWVIAALVLLVALSVVARVAGHAPGGF